MENKNVLEINDLADSEKQESIVARTKLDIFIRKLSIVREILISKQYRSSFKRAVNHSYAQY